MDLGSRIFITGGAGFIGKNLIRNLVEKGYEIVTFDKKLNRCINNETNKN